jgi:hypothetical protein
VISPVEEKMSFKDAVVQMLLILIPVVLLSLINVFGDRESS